MREAQAHPLWLRQVQLEEQMLSLGADAFRQQVADAKGLARANRKKRKPQLSTLRPVHRVLMDWLPQVAAAVVDWRRHAIKSRGCRPIALNYIQEADANLLALLALREVLNCVGEKQAKIVALSYSIGYWAEFELKLRHWEATDKKSYKRAQRFYDNEGSQDKHRARGNLGLFNKINPTHAKWPDEVKFHVGAALIHIVVRATGWFNVDYMEVEGHEPLKAKRSKRSIPLMLVVKPQFTDWLSKQFANEEISRPRLGPTVIPPKPWVGNLGGGYWTHNVPTQRLVRFKAYHQEQRDSANEEYDALDMEQARSSVNIIQSVPWRINKRVLHATEECWKLDMGIASLPVVSPTPKPPKPLDIDTNPEANKQWRHEARDIYHHNNTVVSRVRSSVKIIRSCGGWAPGLSDTDDPRQGTYYNEERFYFPHMLDFRGRMYSIPGGLSPQGHDLARGQLLFADAKPVLHANGGVHWLKIQVANMMGRDKLSTQDRLDYVDANEQTWRDVELDLVQRRDVWSTTKSPWQALAAIIDWAGYLREGDGYMSCLPITVDGTCNGLQHLSALTKDQSSAPLVNLTRADKPYDIYAYVAGLWQASLEEVQRGGCEDAQKADFILGVWNGCIPRSATKRQVMVLPYGGTRDAFYNYTVEAISESIGPASSTLDGQSRTFRNQSIGLASRLLWGICNEQLPGAMAIMQWLQLCSKVIVEGNQPLYWIAPSGFVVRHFYGQQKEGRVNISINGRKMQLRTLETTKELDAQAQTRGVAPNFVHSLDAAALSMTVNRAAASGITHITAIHDAYGSHAADMNKLSKILRQAFVDVHLANPLDIFWAGCQDVLEGVYRRAGADGEEARLLAMSDKPPLPPMGNYDVREVLTSDYFFS